MAQSPAASPRSANSQTIGSLLKEIPWGEVGVPIAVLSVVFAMVTPLPSMLVDVLISANITLSVIIMLVAMFITKPVEFSVFPTMLLLMTLFRLALNVSSSRLILLNGNSGTAAAGEVIQAFGDFVVGGNYIVGTVIFLVLIAIQYVVINHGAVRISEVTARFTLDALPGKQMSIDADLNAGLVDETEAKRRRAALASEAEFYGAMDGASRFTQRDAVASILITGINIVAGFLIGILQHGMDLTKALQTYTILTIGDGLVTVVPALMISVTGGLIVTRASAETRLGPEFRKQIFSNPQPLLLAAAVLLLLAAFPGLPKIPFLLLSAGVGTVGWRLRAQTKELPAATAPTVAPAVKENVEGLLKVEPIAVEVGLGLVRYVEGGAQSPLLRRIAGIRKQLAGDLGYLLPPVRVTDNLAQRAGEYVVSLKGVEIARYELLSGHDLAIPSGPTPLTEGQPTRDPAYGIAAWWVTPDQAERARSAGCTVVDGISVLGTHLGELIRRHAFELFSRQDAKKVLDRVAEENPKAVEDLVPKLLGLSVVQRVLQNLLRERVSIRDAGSIVESLGEAATITKNSVLLTEYVRQGIRRMVVKPYLNQRSELPAYLVDASIETAVESSIEHSEHMSHMTLAPNRLREIIDQFQRTIGTADSATVILTSAAARYFIRQMTESSLPNLVVLSHSEIPPGLKVVSLGMVR